MARLALHERSDSLKNSDNNNLAAVRIVPYTPPRADEYGARDAVYSRSALPTSSIHVFPPSTAATYGQGGYQGLKSPEDDVSQELYSEQPRTLLGSSTSVTHQPPHIPEISLSRPTSALSSPTTLTRPVSGASSSAAVRPLRKKTSRKQLAIDPHTKTFKVLDISLEDVQQPPRQWPSESQRSVTTNENDYDTSMVSAVSTRTTSMLSDDRLRSPVSTWTSRMSHEDQISFDGNDIDDPGRSPGASCLAESTAATSTASTPRARSPLTDDFDNNTATTSSPWNYELVGGLRKVPKTPDSKGKTVRDESPPPSLPDTSIVPQLDYALATKPSFQSDLTVSTTSEDTNYKVYINSSPSPAYPVASPSSHHSTDHPVAESVVSSEGAFEDTNLEDTNLEDTVIHYETYDNSSSEALNSNYELHSGPSSSVALNDNYVLHSGQASSVALNSNYELHGDPSPSASYISLVSPAASYSRESLVVPPLQPRQPHNRRSAEHLGYYKSRSRESLRTGSLTSISTVLSQQEAVQAIGGTGALINIPTISYPVRAWADPGATVGTTRAQVGMQAHPHQWSSQLSTVPSESESGGTDRALSGTWSTGSQRLSGGSGPSRSNHSRQLPSISNSLSQDQSSSSGNHARSDSLNLEPPRPAFIRDQNGSGARDVTGSTIRMVDDEDEGSDRITDMQEVRSRPSRTRLSGLYSVSAESERTNTMRSTTSSRSNSLLGSSLPTWAKLYYGSGEHGWLRRPDTASSSRPQSSFRSGSPDTANFPLNIYSPRRRPREVGQGSTSRGPGRTQNPNWTSYPDDSDIRDIGHERGMSRTGSLMHSNHQWTQRLRNQTSSIWSPHLVRDRRSKRTSVWEVPSVSWSTESGILGKRNAQRVLFIVGFIFPLAWMIAAILPLPSSPDEISEMRTEMRERGMMGSQEELGVDAEADGHGRGRWERMDEERCASARWWRGLNRVMSAVGLVIIILVVVLVVVAFKEGWVKN